MSFNLVIVESPNKCKKIEAYLGAGWKVVASFGHIRDLPAKSMGVEKATQYKPQYVTEDSRGKKQVAQLKKLAKEASCVYLATDPDREGEAIAWHLLDTLKPKNHKRMSFNEMNKKAVLNAVNNTRDIDLKRVKSQEARRVLDRLVGYRVSGPLSNAVEGGKRLSAGRVQSPALRLLVDNQRARDSFKVINHLGVRFFFETESEWYADWLTKPFLTPPNEYIFDQELVDSVAQSSNFVVQSVSDSNTSKKAPPPFTTVSLITAASAVLKINTEKVLEIAQKLFEGPTDSPEGYITYHRTDNPNISDEAYEKISEWVDDNFDPDLLAPERNKFKAKADAQEAHEAIRPTNFEISELNSGDPLMDAMYDLIWDRTVASQLLAARYKKRKVSLVADEQVEGKDVVATIGFSIMTFPGWTELTKKDESVVPTDSDELVSMPNIVKGTALQAVKAKVQQKKTAPPKAFEERSLVTLLEEMGIGRPSTYGSIMGVLRKRGYMIENKKRKLEPTETGYIVVDQLVDRFGFIDYEFTRDIENKLDSIAQGDAEYFDIVSALDHQLDNELRLLPQVEKAAQVLTEFNCTECELPLVLKEGKGNSKFYGCSGYPDCKSSYPEHEGKPFFTTVTHDHPCEDCGDGYLVQRPGKFGMYWPCNNASCKSSRPDNNGAPGEKREAKAKTTNTPGMECPTCSEGVLEERKFKKKPVLGCSTFPGCKHFEWVN